MALGQFDPNAVVFNPTNITVGVTAVPLATSSSLAARFTLVASATNNIYIGNSTVSTTKGIPIAKGTAINFGAEHLIDQKVRGFDLGRIYIIATSASQVTTLMTYNRSGGHGAY